jgi:hypothetical protein
MSVELYAKKHDQQLLWEEYAVQKESLQLLWFTVLYRAWF